MILEEVMVVDEKRMSLINNLGLSSHFTLDKTKGRLHVISQGIMKRNNENETSQLVYIKVVNELSNNSNSYMSHGKIHLFTIYPHCTNKDCSDIIRSTQPESLIQIRRLESTQIPTSMKTNKKSIDKVHELVPANRTATLDSRCQSNKKPMPNIFSDLIHKLDEKAKAIKFKKKKLKSGEEISRNVLHDDLKTEHIKKRSTENLSGNILKTSDKSIHVQNRKRKIGMNPLKPVEKDVSPAQLDEKLKEVVSKIKKKYFNNEAIYDNVTKSGLSSLNEPLLKNAKLLTVKNPKLLLEDSTSKSKFNNYLKESEPDYLDFTASELFTSSPVISQECLYSHDSDLINFVDIEHPYAIPPDKSSNLIKSSALEKGQSVTSTDHSLDSDLCDSIQISVKGKNSVSTNKVLLEEPDLCENTESNEDVNRLVEVEDVGSVCTSKEDYTVSCIESEKLETDSSKVETQENYEEQCSENIERDFTLIEKIISREKPINTQTRVREELKKKPLVVIPQKNVEQICPSNIVSTEIFKCAPVLCKSPSKPSQIVITKSDENKMNSSLSFDGSSFALVFDSQSTKVVKSKINPDFVNKIKDTDESFFANLSNVSGDSFEFKSVSHDIATLKSLQAIQLKKVMSKNKCFKFNSHLQPVPVKILRKAIGCFKGIEKIKRSVQKTQKVLPLREEGQCEPECSLSSKGKPMPEDKGRVIRKNIESRNKGVMSDNYSMTTGNKPSLSQSLLPLDTSSVDDEVVCLTPSTDIISIENCVNEEIKRNKKEISENYSTTADKPLSIQSFLPLDTSSIDDEALCLSPITDIIGVENHVNGEEIFNKNKGEISENYSMTAGNNLSSSQPLLPLDTSTIDDDVVCLTPSTDIVSVKNYVTDVSMINSTKTTNNNSFDNTKLAITGNVPESNENYSELHSFMTVNNSSPSVEEENSPACLSTKSSHDRPSAISEEMEGKVIENKLREDNLTDKDCLPSNFKTTVVREANEICATVIEPFLNNESVSKPEKVTVSKIIKAAADVDGIQASLSQLGNLPTDKKKYFVTHKSKMFKWEPSSSKGIEQLVEKGDHSQLVNDRACRAEDKVNSNLEYPCTKDKSEEIMKIQGNLQVGFIEKIASDQNYLLSNVGTVSEGQEHVPLLINMNGSTNEMEDASVNEQIPDVGIEVGPPPSVPFQRIVPKVPVSSASHPPFLSNQVLRIRRVTSSSTKTKVPVVLKKILKKSGTFNVSNQKVHLTGKSLIIPSSLVRSQPSNDDLLSKQGPNNVQSSSSGVKYIWVCKNKLSNLISSLKDQLSDSFISESCGEPGQHTIKHNVTDDGSVIELSDDSQEASSKPKPLTLNNNNLCLQICPERESNIKEMVNEQDEISSHINPIASSSRLKLKSLSELLTNPMLAENVSTDAEKESTCPKILQTDVGSGKDTSFHPTDEENTSGTGNISENVGDDELNQLSLYKTPSDSCRMLEEANSFKGWNEISTFKKTTNNRRRGKRKKSIWMRNINPKRKVYRWRPAYSKDSSDSIELVSVDSDLVENKNNCSDTSSSNDSFNSASSPLKEMSVTDIYSTIFDKNFEGKLIINIPKNSPPKLTQPSVVSNVDSVPTDQFRIASSAQEVVLNMKRTEKNLLKQFNILNELIIQIEDNLDASGYEYDVEKDCFVLKSSKEKKNLEKCKTSPGKRKLCNTNKSDICESTPTESESEDNFRLFSASTPPPLEPLYEDDDGSKHIGIDDKSPSTSYCEFTPSHSKSGTVGRHQSVHDETGSFHNNCGNKSKTATKNCVQMEQSELSDSHVEHSSVVQNSLVPPSSSQNVPLVIGKETLKFGPVIEGVTSVSSCKISSEETNLIQKSNTKLLSSANSLPSIASLSSNMKEKNNSEKQSLKYCDNSRENLKHTRNKREHEPLIIPNKIHDEDALKGSIASCDITDVSSLPEQSTCALTSIRHQRSSNDQHSDTPPVLEKIVSDSNNVHSPINSNVQNVQSKEEGFVSVETPKPILPSIIVKGDSKSEMSEMPCITNVISLTKVKKDSVRVKPSTMSSLKLRGLSESSRTMFSSESISHENSNQILLRDPPGEFRSVKVSKHSVKPVTRNQFKIFSRPRGRPRKIRSFQELKVKKRTSSPILNKEQLPGSEERSALKKFKKELSELARDIF